MNNGCELLKGCLFFNDRMSDLPSTAELLKQTYCLGDFGVCARYRVATTVGREHVPKDLYPNQFTDADGIIASKS